MKEFVRTLSWKSLSQRSPTWCLEWNKHFAMRFERLLEWWCLEAIHWNLFPFQIDILITLLEEQWQLHLFLILSSIYLLTGVNRREYKKDLWWLIFTWALQEFKWDGHRIKKNKTEFSGLDLDIKKRKNFLDICHHVRGQWWASSPWTVGTTSFLAVKRISFDFRFVTWNTSGLIRSCRDGKEQSFLDGV